MSHFAEDLGLIGRALAYKKLKIESGPRLACILKHTEHISIIYLGFKRPSTIPTQDLYDRCAITSRIRHLSHTRISEYVVSSRELCTCLMDLTDIPLAEFVANPHNHLAPEKKEVYFICRLGNDSQIAADAVRSMNHGVVAKDLIGGLRAWTKDVDPNFPVY